MFIRTFRNITLLFFGLSAATAVFSTSTSMSDLAASLKQGHTIIQVGNYWSNQGEAQHVYMQNLIGDQFTITDHYDNNVLVGLGYFLDGQENDYLKMSYGLNAFYLAQTAVTGNVIQENLFTNLSYQYKLSHLPIYAVARSTLITRFPRVSFTVDVGVGPNFISASNFQEYSLDGVTLPDHIFNGNTTTALSGTIGLGVKVNNVFGSLPLECGYRFFYLGQGHFARSTNQVLSSLSTGNNYANAIVCAVSV